jgi:hypothetical protein
MYPFHNEVKAVFIQEKEGVWGRLVLFGTNRNHYGSGIVIAEIVTAEIVTAEIVIAEIVTAFVVAYPGRVLYPTGGSFKSPVLKLELGYDTAVGAFGKTELNL